MIFVECVVFLLRPIHVIFSKPQKKILHTKLWKTNTKNPNNPYYSPQENTKQTNSKKYKNLTNDFNLNFFFFEKINFPFASENYDTIIIEFDKTQHVQKFILFSQ